jgi:hypothetical protein
MAAETIATSGHRVRLVERMARPARKFLLAGRGGLNLTHSEPLEHFIARYGRASPIVQAVQAFAPADAIAWCAGLGQSTFVGSSGRVFPRTMKASPLLRAWLTRLDALGVTLERSVTWCGWGGDGALVLEDAAGHRRSYGTSALVLALGGASWPRLGSDGGWAPLLRERGIAVQPLTASNAGVIIDWSPAFAARFAGMPLKRIAARVGDATASGEAIVTAQGLEGGIIYALTRAIRACLDSAGTAEITIDLKPSLTVAALAERLARRRKGDTLTNHVRKAGALESVAVGLLREGGGGPLPVNASALAERIKSVTLTIRAIAGLERAISTAGGVALDEIDEHFMLRRLPGVFVAGEMLDWDAPTGGYLLQACLATGVAAGRGVIAHLAHVLTPADRV